MTKTIELLLKVTVEGDKVTVEVDNPNKPLPVMPPYEGPLSVTVDLKPSNTTYSTTWNGSEEMWYSDYKE